MIVLNELTGDIILKKILLTGDIKVGSSASLPAYTGPYTVIPSDSEQVLQTASKRMTQNVTIEKIPGTMENNWGRITWNGAVLTVS